MQRLSLLALFVAGLFTAQLSANDQLPYDRIDADTALIATTLQPLPEATVTAWWQALSMLLPLPAIADTGLDLAGSWAVHTLGSWPVGHWPVRDHQALEQWLDTLPDFAQRRIDDVDFKWRPTPSWMTHSGIVIHHDGDWLSVAWVADEPALLRRVLNLERPRHSFDPESLQHRLSGTALDGHVVARVHPEALANRLPEPICQGEFARLAAAWPELLVGTTDAAADRATLQWTASVTPELGEPLQRLGGGHPSLQSDHPELQGQSASIGVAADVTAGRDAGLALAQFWLSQDWRCGTLAGHTPAMQQLQRLLNRPIPPLFTGIYGARLRLDQVDPLNASAALYLRNPSLIIGLMQLLSPPLAALDLRPGGTPQRLSSETIPGLPDRPLALLSSELALAIGLGEPAIDRLPNAVHSQSGDQTLLRLRLRDEEWLQALALLPTAMRPLDPARWQGLWPWRDLSLSLAMEGDQLQLETTLVWPSPLTHRHQAGDATE